MKSCCFDCVNMKTTNKHMQRGMSKKLGKSTGIKKNERAGTVHVEKCCWTQIVAGIHITQYGTWMADWQKKDLWRKKDVRSSIQAHVRSLLAPFIVIFFWSAQWQRGRERETSKVVNIVAAKEFYSYSARTLWTMAVKPWLELTKKRPCHASYAVIGRT